MDMSGTEKRKGRSGNQGSPSSGKTEKKQSRWHLWPYFQTIPGIIYYQIVSGLILALALNGIRTLSGILMSSAGHEAVTTGDFAFLFYDVAGRTADFAGDRTAVPLYDI